jgi:hypothetical protein
MTFVTRSCNIGALYYKPKCRGFDSKEGYWIFFQFTLSFQLHCGPGVYFAFNKRVPEIFIGVKVDSKTAICEPIV